MIELLKLGISVVPVLIFLLALVFLDSYRLVPGRSVAVSIGVGVLAAGLCLAINRTIQSGTTFSLARYPLYIAPFIEETVKAAYIFVLFKRRRIGFMVDGAIHGFAVGAGFSLIENTYYLLHLESSNWLVWVVRGFGTAAMHGTVTAVFGIMARSLADRYRSEGILIFVPGLIVAIVTHSIFNHFLFSPLLTTIALLFVLPALLLAVFDRSEKMTRTWLGVGFDADQEILRLLSTGEISNSPIGRYLESLRQHFPGTVVADMFCYLTLHTELALRAKGVMLMREAGIKPAADPEISAKLTEMQYLERSIGKTGLLAVQPFMHTSSRDIWQLRTIQ